MFAQCLLQYDALVLPPRNPRDVCKWMVTFTCSYTASNYKGYVKFVCEAEGLDTTWDNDQVRWVINGRHNIWRRIQSMTQSKPICCPNRKQISEAIRAMIADHIPALPCVTAIAWQYLTRCQSETFPLRWGSIGDILELPDDIDSAVVVTYEPVLRATVRWRTRNNRPRGSTLHRRCTCDESEVTCAPHQLLKWYTYSRLSWQICIPECTLVEHGFHTEHGFTRAGAEHAQYFTLIFPQCKNNKFSNIMTTATRNYISRRLGLSECPNYTLHPTRHRRPTGI